MFFHLVTVPEAIYAMELRKPPSKAKKIEEIFFKMTFFGNPTLFIFLLLEASPQSFRLQNIHQGLPEGPPTGDTHQK